MYRVITFTVLILSGFVGVVASLFLDRHGTAWAIGILFVGLCIVFGIITSWYHGVKRLVAAHVGPRWQQGVVLRHRLRTAERVNLQVVLDWLQEQSSTPGPFGIPHISATEEEDPRFTVRPADMVATLNGNPEPVAIVWEPMPTSSDGQLHCASNALYLLRVLSEPVCVMVQGRNAEQSKPALFQVLARTQPVAQASLTEILRQVNEQSVYRGQVISLERIKGTTNDLIVKFHDLGRVERNGIILSGNVLEILERNVLSFFRHADALRKAGQGTRHGVLLHGSPGTGKTLATRWIATNVSATVLLVTGRQYAQLRATCQLARLLAPSLVILEDVDLIATDRRRNTHTPLLHELLDEMDGLSHQTEIVFLLTTNRPETLEPALAARPGRVDQAIFFPLPDLECRRRLFACFSQGVNVRGVDLEPLLLRTEGASPAFIKEVFRRATLLAVERGEKTEPLTLRAEDFERGLRELVETGGEWTRRFLGFPTR